MDGAPLTCKFANGCQAVIQGQGHFHQTRVTVGDIACSVKGYKQLFHSLWDYFSCKV